MIVVYIVLYHNGMGTQFYGSRASGYSVYVYSVISCSAVTSVSVRIALYFLLQC